MDGREIEAFLVLAEELHFGRTAQRLGVSPGRVSQLLVALERRTGRQLVLRSSRAVGLSAAGEQFLAEARTGYRQLEQAIAVTRAAARQDAGVLRLGTSVWLDPAAGPALAEAFEHRHRGWRAECIPVRPADLPGPLTVDVLLLPVPGPVESVPAPSGVVAGPVLIGPVLARHERVLVVPGDHPLAGHAVVSPADLAGHEVASPADHLAAWHPDGHLPAAGGGSSGGETAPRALEPHDAFDLVVRRGLAFLSSTGTAHLFRGVDVTRIPVPELPPVCTVLARRAGPPGPLTAAFLAMATEFATPALMRGPADRARDGGRVLARGQRSAGRCHAVPMAGQASTGGEKYFALRTFRRDGSPVSTPIWLAPSVSRLYGYTPSPSWKVRRLRQNPRVEIAPSDFTGKPHGQWRSGNARSSRRQNCVPPNAR